MKIAHIVDSMEIGGAETLVSHMCRLQRSQGHEPSIHCMLRLGVLGEELRQDGFDVRLYRRAHFPCASWDFLKAFRKLRPDVVHCHNLAATIYAAPVARMAGARKVIATRHHFAPCPYSIEVKFSLASRFCDWVVGVCDTMVKNMASAPLAYRANLTRVYNGTPLPPVSTIALPQRGDFTLVHVARLQTVKNQRMLLDSFALARQQMPTLALWIVGDGPLRTELEQHASSLGINEAVTFWGEQTAVYPYLRAADAFVLCSTSEGLPASLLEAMSVGLPVIVTDVGGMPEVVRLARCGLVAPTDSAEALATAMLSLGRDRKQCADRGESGKRCFERLFTLSAMADAYMDLYSGQVSADRNNVTVKENYTT